MVYKYSWRAGSYPVSAQDAGEYLDEMSRINGSVTARNILDASRKEDALLHPCFDWNDETAAEAHRLYQARKLIGNLVCAVVKENEEKTPVEKVRAFVNVSPAATEGYFRPIADALSSEENRLIVLENAKRDAIAFRDKYSTLVEFAEVFSAIEKVISK